MGLQQAGTRVLVLSDDAKLFRAIEVNLRNSGSLEVVGLTASSPEGLKGAAPSNSFDLLVVATSAPHSEPVVMLAQAALADRIGRVPVLIISDRPFRPDPEARIAHLGFPFGAEELDDKVRGVLQAR